MGRSRGGGGTGGPDLPPPPPPPTKKKKKSQKYRVLSNTAPDPLKQARAIIGTPAKCHLNGVSLAGRLWPAYSGIWILPPLINKKTQKNFKVGPL